MAFCPPQPTYRAEDVNMWLTTDRGDRIPAFHIRRGNPLTLLVSHANAEDLGIVLSYWAYMAHALQVSDGEAVAQGGRPLDFIWIGGMQAVGAWRREERNLGIVLDRA